MLEAGVLLIGAAIGVGIPVAFGQRRKDAETKHSQTCYPPLTVVFPLGPSAAEAKWVPIWGRIRKGRECLDAYATENQLRDRSQLKWHNLLLERWTFWLLFNELAINL